MACGCQKNREQFEVLNEQGNVVYTASSQATANTVAKRYPNSSVRPKSTQPATANG
jgi:hypothetical protein